MSVRRPAYPPKGLVDVRAGAARAQPARAWTATIEKRILAVIKFSSEVLKGGIAGKVETSCAG